jgi:type VI secretion system protein VasD
MNIFRLVSLLMALSLTMALGSCSKPRIDLSVASQSNVNPDHSGRPSPIIVKMYELRGDLSFKQSDFQSLFQEPVQTLGADLIAADELLFVPGEARHVIYEPMPETRFVGIVGGFRQMERAQWRAIAPIDPEKINLVPLELNDVSLILVPADADWKPEERVRSYQTRTQEPQKEQSQPSGQEKLEAGKDPSTAQGAGTAIERTKSDTQQQGYIMPKARRAQ